MIRSSLALLAVLLTACGGYDPHPPFGDFSIDSGPVKDAGRDATDAADARVNDAASDSAPADGGAEADAAIACGGKWNVVVDTRTLGPVDPAGGTLVTIKGKCLSIVTDVEVNIYSIPFTIVDDSTITFTAPSLAFVTGDADDVELPAQLQFFVIHNPSDQDGGFITYQ